ncbi:MAG: lipopolysaccharide heptosyltransferase II [Candidatus Omnitrophica bacterium]|nr:lipopolysaccharide heptosyltransferase II [Candidatus Omnitrophota bacterium]
MKILIFTKNWVGDLLFQMPAIDAVAAQWPEAEIVCLVPARCREMLRAHPRVSRVLIFDERREQKSWPARLAFGLKLRGETWDRAFLFHRSRTRAFIAFLAGARERAGYGKKRAWLLTQTLEEPAEKIHHVDYFLNLVRAAGVQTPENQGYRFYFSQEDELQALDLMTSLEIRPRGFVCFHLGANWEPKRWPPEHFARLAEKIHEHFGLAAVLTGAPEDRPLAEAVLRHAGRARVLSLIGRTGLRVLGALFSRSACVVSGDSGPMHIAAGSGARVAALFGPTDPAQTGPRGQGESLVIHHVPEGFTSPWYGSSLPEGGWLSKIEPEEVFEALRRKGWLQPAPAERGTGAE